MKSLDFDSHPYNKNSLAQAVEILYVGFKAVHGSSPKAVEMLGELQALRHKFPVNVDNVKAWLEKSLDKRLWWTPMHEVALKHGSPMPFFKAAQVFAPSFDLPSPHEVFFGKVFSLTPLGIVIAQLQSGTAKEMLRSNMGKFSLSNASDKAFFETLKEEPHNRHLEELEDFLNKWPAQGSGNPASTNDLPSLNTGMFHIDRDSTFVKDDPSKVRTIDLSQKIIGFMPVTDDAVPSSRHDTLRKALQDSKLFSANESIQFAQFKSLAESGQTPDRKYYGSVNFVVPEGGLPSDLLKIDKKENALLMEMLSMDREQKLSEFFEKIAGDRDKLVELHNQLPEIGSSIQRVLWEGQVPREIVASLNFDFDYAVRDGLTTLGEALKGGQLITFGALRDTGSTRLTANADARYVVPGLESAVEQKELVDLFLQNLHSVHINWRQAFHEAGRLFDILRSPYQTFLYSLALKEFADQSPSQEGLAFFQLASNLLYLEPGRRPIQKLLKSMQLSLGHSMHPNEADLLLLLNSPDGSSDTQMVDNAAWAKVTSSDRSNIRTATARHWALSRIGSLTYSFTKWRGDTISVRERAEDGSLKVIAPSLMEEFGMSRIDNDPAKPHTSDRFGVQFKYQDPSESISYLTYNGEGEARNITLSKNTKVYMRQGYMLVTNPHFGSLLIRNSSPQFGRTLLPYTSRYFEYELTNAAEEEFSRPTERLLHSGVNSVDLYDRESLIRVNFLIDELICVHTEFGKFKFDTSPETAWLEDDGQKVLVGGHKSRGFKSAVDKIAYLYAAEEFKGNSISLAFVHKDFPAFKQYSFTDANNRQSRQVLVDEQVLRELRNLANAEDSDAIIVSSELRNFFQEAGFAKNAELVVLFND